MKIMSFNTQHCLNYVTKEIDFELMADTIKNCGADIIGLNEMRNRGIHPDYKDQVGILSELTGIEHKHFARALRLPFGLYGNGLLSKIPIVSTETIMIYKPSKPKYDGYYETRCLLKAKLENGITLLITHFGLNLDEQERAVKTVVKHITDEKCILMGDFNVTPDNSVLNPIRKKMKDTADYFSAPLLSFPSDKPNRKIDYIFVSKDIEVITADIPAVVASDHRPHLAEIRI